MPLTASLLLIAFALAGCSHSQEGREFVVHDFSASAEGWQIAGDTGPRSPVYHATGGRSGGYIANTDEAVGETWYFRAPASLLSQLAAAEGGHLAFSLKQDSAEVGFPDDDVVIVGAAGRLSYRFENAPGTDWTDYDVPLSASANWQWNWNARATPEQIRAVLSNPSRLEIRGEYRTGDDTAGLDHVVVRR